MTVPSQHVSIHDYESRSFKRYKPGHEPYNTKNDPLQQKLWFVVEAEFGPGAADVLVHKLHQAVIDHITHGPGIR